MNCTIDFVWQSVYGFFLRLTIKCCQSFYHVRFIGPYFSETSLRLRIDDDKWKMVSTYVHIIICWNEQKKKRVKKVSRYVKLYYHVFFFCESKYTKSIVSKFSLHLRFFSSGQFHLLKMFAMNNVTSSLLRLIDYHRSANNSIWPNRKRVFHLPSTSFICSVVTDAFLACGMLSIKMLGSQRFCRRYLRSAPELTWTRKQQVTYSFSFEP